MASGFTQDLLEEIRGGVGDDVLLVEAVVGLHESADAYDAVEAGQVTIEFRFKHGQRVKNALGGGGLGVFDGRDAWDGTCGEEGAIFEGELARDNHKGAGTRRGDVGGDGLGGGGQGEIEISELVFDGHGLAPGESE